ncbi:hypothetical protein AV530_006259 [Patagioenas fasciata monilis]|uniref:Uncharacterized protein n=1 Tax=Patagioenas fasciata monilis TaxID=372326 RepID=A0A1V4KHQ0_PATFA|nr:hypothetical protein AV530_006259 [Patagioenas fasciata monilis]
MHVLRLWCYIPLQGTSLPPVNALQIREIPSSVLTSTIATLAFPSHPPFLSMSVFWSSSNQAHLAGTGIQGQKQK